jgi:hypothetical protein
MLQSLVGLSPWLIVMIVALARARSIANALMCTVAAITMLASRDRVRVSRARYLFDALSVDLDRRRPARRRTLRGRR